MEKKKEIGYVVPHTHWDREWRYPIWKMRMLLVEFMDELLMILDTNPEYKCFVLDGQCIVLEDYLEVRPQMKEKIIKYVKEGKITAGPWYTAPDLYPIDGESLIRNLLKGTRISDSLGGCMKVGYNTFGWGQTAQFPQIYKGFDIDVIICAKKVSNERAPQSEFMWESPDGTKVLTTRLGHMARANLFMNAYLPILHDGVTYIHEVDGFPSKFKFNYGKPGLVYHQANEDKYFMDHFRNEYPDNIDDSLIEEFVQKAWDGTSDTTVKSHRILMNGCDFSSAQPKLTELINKSNKIFDNFELVNSTLEEYTEKLKELVDYDKLKIINGELRDGSAGDTTGNALQTRSYIKRLNKKVQNEIFMNAEPLSAIGLMVGIPYQKEFLELGIKHMLQSHAHDSINGVTQDKTANDIYNRLTQALEIGEVVSENVCGEIFKKIDTSIYSKDEVLMVAVNTTQRRRREIVKCYVDIPREFTIWDFDLVDENNNVFDVQFISRKEETACIHDLNARPWPFFVDRYGFYFDTGELPSGGYKVYKLAPKRWFKREKVYWAENRTFSGKEIAKATNRLENEFINLMVQSNGAITMTDKVTGTIYNNFNYYEDTGSHANLWVHYPPYANKTYTSLSSNAKIWIEDNGPLSATIVSEIIMNLPAFTIVPENSIKGESRRSDEFKDLVITTSYTLKRGEQKVDVKTRINNTIEDHRIRVMFDTGIVAEKACAAGHFTVDKRNVDPIRDKNGEYYPEMQTLPQQYFVDLSDGVKGITLINNCMSEYEAAFNEERTLSLTLLRSNRIYLATDNFVEGAYPHEKGGQCLGMQEYDYSIYPHNGNWENANAYENAINFNVPVKMFQISSNHQGSLPLEMSFFSIEPSNLVLSALKKAEDRNSIILRLFNPTDCSIEGQVKTHAIINEAYLTNLNEERTDSISVFEEHSIKIKADSNKIVTIELVF